MTNKEHLENIKKIDLLTKNLPFSDNFSRDLDKIDIIIRKYIDGFKKELRNQRLSDKVIKTHVNNAYFFWYGYYVQQYFDNPFNSETSLEDFFGYYFIRKCLWSTENSLKTYLASLKKFYLFLYKENYIDEDKCATVLATLKCGKERWLEELYDYNYGDMGDCDFF